MARGSSDRQWIATALAHAVLADADQPGGRSAGALQGRMAACIGARPPWLAPLAAALARRLAPLWPRQTVASLSAFLRELPEFDEAFDADHPEHLPRIRRLLLRPARMAAPPFALEALRLPPLPTPADLAAWLGLTPERLDWLLSPAQNFRERPFAPAHAHCPPGLHYWQLLKPKHNGSLRLIEIPKGTLRSAQRRILHGLLDLVPVHEAAHGFVKQRGVLTHAAPHVGQAVVLAFDLRDFFNSIGVARIRAAFRTLGYPEPVAAALAALCTTRTPAGVRERLREACAIGFLGDKRLAAPHLPQGAPTSPALANLCAFGLDLRLDGLAWRFGARYSRYADDIVFSGPAELLGRRRALHAWVEAIVRAEGFALHPGKTRTMPRHAQQRVTGVVVNDKHNLDREAYDRLRAELHAAARGGCDAATRAHLQGRVAWALQLVCGSRRRKLLAMLAAVPQAPTV